MKKKKTIIFVVLMILLATTIFLILLNRPNKINETKELANSEYKTVIGTTEYDIDGLIETNIVPILSAGMIPVKLEGEDWVVIDINDNTWYDYEKGNPAYMKLNDGTVYMWIPRYAYNNEGDIIYIKQGCCVAGNWTMPDIFSYTINNENKPDLSLLGIWVEYMPINSSVNTKIANMEGENNKYDFIANTKCINADNESAYTETIEKFMGAKTISNNELINNLANKNRTILKIVNTNKFEPMKVKGYYDKAKDKIEIKTTYSLNQIEKIVDSSGKVLSMGNEADSGEEVIGNKIYKYTVIDKAGNQKQINVSVTGLDVYIIANEDDLKYFRNQVNGGKTKATTKAYQIADVTMNEGNYTIDDVTKKLTFTSEAEIWTPIGSSAGYTGKYYGNNHTISGMYINGGSVQGLFKRTSGATITGIGIINSYIAGSGSIGSILGIAQNNTIIENCYSEATIESTGNSIGGIVGATNSGTNTIHLTIKNCYNKGKVTGYTCIGGIIGNVCYANIQNCYNSGDISSSTDSSGGLTGYLGKGNVKNCYNIGNISGNSNVSGLIGNNSSNGDAII